MSESINKWDIEIPVEKSNYLHEEHYKIIRHSNVYKKKGEYVIIDLFSGAGIQNTGSNETVPRTVAQIHRIYMLGGRLALRSRPLLLLRFWCGRSWQP